MRCQRNRDNLTPTFPLKLDGHAVLFDSNAILLYIAEKTGLFLPPDTCR